MIREGKENGREDAQDNQALAAPRKEVPFKTRVSGHDAGFGCLFESALTSWAASILRKEDLSTFS
jgi:hypothetical protein